jgi:WD40 repeat protein
MNLTKQWGAIIFLLCLSACSPTSVETPNSPISGGQGTQTAAPLTLISTSTNSPTSSSVPTITVIPEIGLVQIDAGLPEGATAWELPNVTIRQVAYSPNGEYLAVAGNAIFILRADTLELWTKLSEVSEVLSITWSPDSQLIAGGTSDGMISVWDLKSMEKIANFMADSAGIRSLVWSPTADLLVGTVGGIPKIWNALSGEETTKLDAGTEHYSSLAWSPDGLKLAGGEAPHGFIMIWDSATGEQLQQIPELPAQTEETPWITWVNSLAWSQNGQWLASGLGTNSASGQSLVVIYDPNVDDAKNILVLQTDPAEIQGIQTDPNNYHAPSDVDAVGWSPDSNLLVSGAYNGMLPLWKLSTGEIVARLDNTGAGKSVSWSPDGEIIAIGNYDGLLILWNVSQYHE